MAEPFWQIKYKGNLAIRLEINDLSNQRLREMKAAFGPAYGIPTEFISLLLRGDLDAVSGAVWIGQQKAAVEVEDLLSMEFTLDDVEPLEDPKPKGKGKDKGERPTKPGTTTDGSVETPSTSETPTSGTSTT